jgi:copper chaperone
MESAVMTVEGMVCDHCESLITIVIQGIKGVKTVAVDPENRTVSVGYDDSEVNIGFIRAAIEDQGYDVVREE